MSIPHADFFSNLLEVNETDVIVANQSIAERHFLTESQQQMPFNLGFPTENGGLEELQLEVGEVMFVLGREWEWQVESGATHCITESWKREKDFRASTDMDGVRFPGHCSSGEDPD